MKKKNIMPVIVLSAICIIVALLLGVINHITAPIIEDNNNEAVIKSLQIAMPEGIFDPTPDELRDDAPNTVKSVYTEKNGRGHVVILVTNKGYTGKDIGITVGIDNVGQITKAVITKNEESIVPQNMKPFGSYGDAYSSATADEVVDVVTGATVVYSETAIKNAIYDAFVYLGYAKDTSDDLPRTDGELLALAGELMPEASGFENITPEGKTFLKRLYKDTAGGGYVAYTHTYAQYGGTLESETMIAVNREGKITSIKKLFWKTGSSDTYTPPDNASVDAFYQGFVGKSVNDIGSAEIVTGATGTGTNVRNAIAEVLDTISGPNIPEEKPSYTARIVGIAILSLAAIAAAGAIIYSKRRKVNR